MRTSDGRRDPAGPGILGESPIATGTTNNVGSAGPSRRRGRYEPAKFAEVMRAVID